MNRIIYLAAVLLPVGLSSEEEMPTLLELIKELFAFDVSGYENLNFGTGILTGLRGLIIALFLGAIFAACSSVFNKRVLGAFVRALISEGCTSPDKAKTLAELGFLKNTAIRSSLRSGGVLGKAVSCVEEDAHNIAVVRKRGIYELRSAESEDGLPPFRELPYKRDLNTAHFYIPEQKAGSAEIRFSKKGTNWVSLVLGIIASIVVLVLLLVLLPDIFQLIDNFVGMTKDFGA